MVSIKVSTSTSTSTTSITCTSNTTSKMDNCSSIHTKAMRCGEEVVEVAMEEGAEEGEGEVAAAA